MQTGDLEMKKRYGKEIGYTLLEVIFVLIFIILSILGSIYYIHYEKVFSTANSIAGQFNYIANSVIKYDWVSPDKEGELFDYSLDQLMKFGVLKEKMNFSLNYGVRMYWNDKKSYTVLVYVKTPVSFTLDELASISGLIGPDGGYVNDSGQIVMSAARIWNNILSKNELGIRSDTPVLIKQVGLIFDSRKKRRMDILEKIVESGSIVSSLSFFSDDSYTSNMQEWNPAFTDDEINISWGSTKGEKDRFSVTLIDTNSDKVIYETSGWGDNLSLYPKSSWLSKRVTLAISIYNGIYVTTVKRNYYISPKGLSVLNAKFSVEGYAIPAGTNILRPVSLSNPVKLHNGSPLILCINNVELSLGKQDANNIEHWLLVPIVAKIEGDTDNAPFAVSSYNIEKVPFSSRIDNIDYDLAKSECVFFADANKKTSIAIDHLDYKEMSPNGMIKEGTITNKEDFIVDWN